MRTMRLALVVVLCMDLPQAIPPDFFTSFPELKQIVEAARVKRRDAASRSASGATFPVPRPPITALPPPPPPPQPVASMHPQVMSLVPLPAADPRAPRECLEDPWCELRPWSANDPVPCMWPFCTLCDCWSDLAHLRSKKHTSRTAYHRPPAQNRPPQPTGSQTVLPCSLTSSALWPASSLADSPSSPLASIWSSATGPVGGGSAAAAAAAAPPHPATTPQGRVAPEPPTSDEMFSWFSRLLDLRLVSA